MPLNMFDSAQWLLASMRLFGPVCSCIAQETQHNVTFAAGCLGCSCIKPCVRTRHEEVWFADNAHSCSVHGLNNIAAIV